jgi:hypothetical protein
MILKNKELETGLETIEKKQRKGLTRIEPIVVREEKVPTNYDCQIGNRYKKNGKK